MNKLPKILMISARSDMGGGPKHLCELIEQLYEKQPEAELYCASPLDAPYGPKFQTMPKKHFKIPTRSFSLIKFFQLLDFCKKNDIKIIHSHGRGAGLYSRLLGLFNFFIIHTLHGAHNEKGLIGQLKLNIDKFLVNLTDQFICVSTSEKEKAIQLKLTNPGCTSVIFNGVDSIKIEQVPPLNLHQKLNIVDNKKIWGCVTRLSPEKGNQILLKTLAQRPEQYKDYAFVIAGDGPQRQVLENQALKLREIEIHFLGQIDNPIAFIKGLDGLLSFSLGEGLPYAVLEALACQRPCILSNVSGHQEFQNQCLLFDLKEDIPLFQYLTQARASSLPKDFELSVTTDQVLKCYNKTQQP